LIQLTPQTSDKERKTIEKEIRIHAALKHENVLQFITASVVEPDGTHIYVPGIYIMMELAAGGDLFDKIGMVAFNIFPGYVVLTLYAAPDVGVGDDIAHFYFNQLLSGMVSLSTFRDLD
jgi:serine/threonine-protein kinase Chk1